MLKRKIKGNEDKKHSIKRQRWGYAVGPTPVGEWFKVKKLKNIGSRCLLAGEKSSKRRTEWMPKEKGTQAKEITSLVLQIIFE